MTVQSSDTVTKVLLLLVAVGFTAWAGVVYRATDKVETTSALISSIDTRMTVIERDVGKLLTKFENRDGYHDPRADAKLNGLIRRVEKLEKQQ